MLQVFLVIKIHTFLALHRHLQGKFLRVQSIKAASFLTILSNIEQDYTAASDGIGTDYKDEKYAVTPVIFNFPDKFILILVYWAVVLVSMKFVINKSKLDYLLGSRRSYTPAKRSALAFGSFEDSVYEITMNVSTFTYDNACAYNALIPGIFVTLAKQVLTATIKNKKDFRGFYEAF